MATASYPGEMHKKDGLYSGLLAQTDYTPQSYEAALRKRGYSIQSSLGEGSYAKVRD